tara:strand:+ start:68 stop:211 length:144 start_codon:yes stop_codon:yes gene_type:complete
MENGIEIFLEDPIIQLVLLVIAGICIFDAFKFILLWVWKMLGGKEEE